MRILFLTLVILTSYSAAIGQEQPKSGSAAPQGIAAATPTRGSANTLHDQLVNNEKQLTNAEVKKSAPFFQKALAPDFIDVAYNGLVLTKETILKNLQYVNVNGAQMKNFKLRRLGKDAALITYDLDEQASVAGHKTPQKQYASSVWIDQNGHWLLVFHQVTPAEHH